MEEEFVVTLDKNHSRTWQIMYIVFPMLPFLLSGGIKIITLLHNLSLTLVFYLFSTSASDLAICLALLSLFISQSLAKSERILDNEDKKAETQKQILIFLVFAIISLILFTLIVLFSTMVNYLQDEHAQLSLYCCGILTFVLMIIVINLSIKTQQSFRLRANIWG